jgi:lysozyme
VEPSKRLYDHVRSRERLRLKPYRCPSGIPTQGYGHTKGVFMSSAEILPAQAETWLKQDVEESASAVRRLVKVELTQGQFDALVDFVFNIGADEDADDIAEGLGDSTLLHKLNAGDYAGAAAEFGKWKYGKVNGKKIVMGGLVERRKVERAWFLEPAEVAA